LLLMDEPTTHLDIPSIDALVGALKIYSGTLVFISHDVYFIRELAQTVLHVHSGRLTRYAGNYDYYLDKSKATNAREALTAGFTDARPRAAPLTPALPNVKVAKSREARPATVMQKELRDLRTEIAKLEKNVVDLEEKQADLSAALEAPETYADAGKAQHLNRELSATVDLLTAANKAWEQAAERLGALELEAG
jgi:ATP-binding cassette, subfamily F, member 3